MSSGVRGEALEARRAAAAALALSVLGLGVIGILAALLLAPTSFGEKTPFLLEGRILLALVAGGGLALSTVMLALAVALFRSASFSRAFVRLRHRWIGPFPSETSLLMTVAALVLGLVLAGGLYAAAPTPTEKELAVERQHDTATKAAADRTRNVHPLGSSAVDGEFVFSVRSIRRVASVPQEGSPAAKAGDGEKLEIVRISVTNNADRALPPFGIPGLGALLIDGRGTGSRPWTRPSASMTPCPT